MCVAWWLGIRCIFCLKSQNLDYFVFRLVEVILMFVVSRVCFRVGGGEDCPLLVANQLRWRLGLVDFLKLCRPKKTFEDRRNFFEDLI